VSLSELVSIRNHKRSSTAKESTDLTPSDFFKVFWTTFLDSGILAPCLFPSGDDAYCSHTISFSYFNNYSCFFASAFDLCLVVFRAFVVWL